MRHLSACRASAFKTGSAESDHNSFKKYPALIRTPFVMLMMLTMLIMLTGCHGKKGVSEFVLPEKLDTTRNIDITFWNKNDSNKVQVDVYKKAISDFQKLYPNITVNMKAYTDYGRIFNDVITNISTGTTPNICITYPDHIATYLTGGNVVVPLDELMEDPEYGLDGSGLLFKGPSREEIVPEFLEECVLSGRYYAMPFMRSTEACYINADMVEALGYEVPDILTWEFMWEVSEKAMEQNPDGTFRLNGQNVLIPVIYKSTDNMMISMLKQLDAGYSTAEGEILIFNDSTLDILKTVGEQTGKGVFSTFKISSYPGNFLNANQCIFAIDSTAGATWMGTESPNSDIAEENERPFRLAVRPIPQYDVTDPWMISQGPSVSIFNKQDPQEVLASWLFLQYLLSNEVQIPYAQSEGYLPVTTIAHESQEYQEYLAASGMDDELHYAPKIEASKLLLNNTANTFVTPVFNGSASLRNAAGALIEDTAKAVRRNKRVDEDFIEGEYESVTSLYRLDSVSAAGAGKADLGPLPAGAKILLSTLAFIWAAIIIYLAYAGIFRKHS